MTDTFQASIETIEDVHPEIRILCIRPISTGLTWHAGQYMELMFDGFPARPYSIASAPHTGLLEFHIRNTGQGGVSEHAVKSLKKGDPITLRGPFGHVVMVADDPLPVIMIGGGMGLSPMKAMAEDALYNNHPAPITLYWGVRDQTELYLSAHLENMAKKTPAFHYIPVVENADNTALGAAIDHHQKSLAKTRIYIAGPPAMVAAIVPILLERGADPDYIHGDDVLLHSLRSTRALG